MHNKVSFLRTKTSILFFTIERETYVTDLPISQQAMHYSIAHSIYSRGFVVMNGQEGEI